MSQAAGGGAARWGARGAGSGLRAGRSLPRAPVIKVTFTRLDFFKGALVRGHLVLAARAWKKCTRAFIAVFICAALVWEAAELGRVPAFLPQDRRRAAWGRGAPGAGKRGDQSEALAVRDLPLPTRAQAHSHGGHPSSRVPTPGAESEHLPALRWFPSEVRAISHF